MDLECSPFGCVAALIGDFFFTMSIDNEAGNLLPKVFTFNDTKQQVRTLLIENQPYFAAKDVCDVLGHSNPSVAIQMLDDYERAKKSLGRQGETWVVLFF